MFESPENTPTFAMKLSINNNYGNSFVFQIKNIIMFSLLVACLHMHVTVASPCKMLLFQFTGTRWYLFTGS